ncbi:MAG: beta-ketoacyl-ACP synthase II [Chloroflexi bacterium]|nr:beta-ketoacyl-ACP synthase II [Chloroflexota bacterium]
MENGYKRVVVTGTGLVTPLGHNVADSWAGILAGKSGFGPITLFNTTGHTSGGACEVKEFDAEAILGRREARRRDRFEHLAAVATIEALAQSGLKITDDNRQRIGVIIGTGIGGLQTTVDQEAARNEGGPRRVSPFAIPMIMVNGAAGMAAIDYGIQGPSFAVTTACAAGCDGVGQAFRYIKYGIADAMLTGGVEAPLVSVAIASFERAGATSIRTEGTPSPFDKDRDGLVPGEGAGILVLESLDHALARGASILGEIVGYGQTTDAHHITAPAEGGAGASRAILAALAEAGLRPEDVDYVNAHGTGTVLNDSAETAAIKTAFGEHAYNLAVSSTKSMTGHIMGGTGAIETVFCLLAMRDQMIPPTINFNEGAADCDLDYVPNYARPGKVTVATNHAFGFGGHNAVLAIRQYSG